MDEINSQNIALEAEARKTTSQQRLKELASISDNLAEIVAQNIAASPELLTELASHESKAVRKAVTCNPKTPTEIFLELGEYFPQELLNNPAFELLLLGNLKSLEEIPIRLLSILIQYRDTPKFILDSILENEELDFEIINIAKMHVIVSGEIKKGWHEVANKMIAQIEDDEDIISQLDDSLEHDNNYWLDDFEFLANFYDFISPRIYQNKKLKKYLARNPQTTTSFLKQLANDPDWNIRNAVTDNPNTPISILEKLANDANVWVRTGVAGNPNTPRKILEQLANDSSRVSYIAIARNPNTPSEVLKKLANDENIDVRANVSRNKNTPLTVLEKFAVQDRNFQKGVAINHSASVEILEQLFIEGDEWICSLIARNPATPSKMLIKLANDSRNSIRVSLAENLSTPIKVLEKLAIDVDDEVRLTVAKNQNTPKLVLEKLIIDSNHEIHIGVAMNLNTSTKLLEKLATHSDREVRLAVAKNQNTPITTLEKFAVAEDRVIRIHTAEHPNASIEILEQLANDLVYKVRIAVAKNPKCTCQIKETIFKNFAKLDTPSFSRVALFLSDYAESSVLAENSNSISWLERYAVAQNKNTPQDTLQILAQDSNRIVRATAKESLQQYDL